MGRDMEWMWAAGPPAGFWLALLVVLLLIEIATLGLVTIWFAGGALAATLARVAGAPVGVQIVLFLAVSLLLLYFTRPVAVRYFNRGRTRTNVESMAGKTGIVTGRIDNVQGSGQVTVDGMEWTARSETDAVIEEGTVVTVRGVRGVKLMVEERKEGEE